MLKKLLIFFFIFCSNVMADVSVICHPNVSVNSLTKIEIKKIFLGKSSTFPDGSAVKPIDLAIGSNTREIFYQNVIRKSETWLKVYWSRKTLTGRGIPPEEEDNDLIVKEIVANDPLMLGYVDSKIVDNRVKVLYKISSNSE